MKNFKILILFIISILIFHVSSFKSEATSSFYSNLTEQEIKDLYQFTSLDIPEAWKWAMNDQSYVMIEEINDQIVYWWNAPNIQRAIKNDAWDTILTSGYGQRLGVGPIENSNIIALQQNPKTAMERFGFKIPSITYMGERPLVSINVYGIVTPDNLWDGIGRWFKGVYTGVLVDAPSNKDLTTLTYLAPNDYGTFNNSFKNWVESYWYDFCNDMDENEMGYGQILLPSATPVGSKKEGMKDDKQWTYFNIVVESGLNTEGKSSEQIISELQMICGKYYSEVATCIVMVSGFKDLTRPERIMTYDLDSLNPEDKELFNGIQDPRTEKQKNLFETGYFNIMSLAPPILNFSGSIAEATVVLNSITTFDFLDKMGFDYMILWESTILDVIISIMLIAFVFKTTKTALDFIVNKETTMRIITQLLSSFLIVFFVVAISLQPQKVLEIVKTSFGIITSIGDISIADNPNIESLYGTGDRAERFNVDLWLPYFDTWTRYNTNHSIMDKEQRIDISTGPELNGLSIPSIDSVNQNLWSTILADSFSTPKLLSGNIYRVVDHFMAPRIELIDASSVDFNVTENENYNGSIQSKIYFGSFPSQFFILIIMFLKVLLFYEFIFNLIMLILKLALAATSNKEIIRVIKELFASMFNIAIANIFISISILLSLNSNSLITSIIIISLLAFILYSVINNISMGNSVFCPKFIKVIFKFWRSITAPNGNPNGYSEDEL